MSAMPLAADGFVSPGPGNFVYEGLGGTFVNKTILIVLIMTALVAVFYVMSSRKAAVVPTRLQFLGESVYGFVRNSVAIDSIGHQGIKYVPYLATLFSFVAVLNVAGIIPFLQFPATSRIAIPLFLAIISWAIFMTVGIRRVGFGEVLQGHHGPAGGAVCRCCSCWPRSSSSRPSSSGRSRSVCVSPSTCSPATSWLLLFVLGGEYLVVDYGGVGRDRGRVGVAASAASSSPSSRASSSFSRRMSSPCSPPSTSEGRWPTSTDQRTQH